MSPRRAAQRGAGRAVAPHLQQQFDLRQRQRAKWHLATGSEYDDFTQALSRRSVDQRRGRIVRVHGKGREPVFKHGNCILSFRQLGRINWIDAYCQRNVLGRLEEGASLTIGCVGNPFASQRMPT